MFGAMAAAGQGLAAIKSVALKSLDLDGVAPSWLASTCPNMTSLQLHYCTFTTLPDATTASIPVCTQLKELTLSGALPDLTQPSQFVRWQQQLSALPGLQSLTVGQLDLDDMKALLLEDVPRFLEACSVIGPQLTHLKLAYIIDRPNIPANLAVWFPSVTELHLDVGTVRDEDMEVLLGMHNLRKLHCSDFRLEASYVNRPCPWTQLALHSLDIGSLSLLPLRGVTSLKIDHRRPRQAVSIYLSADQQHAQKAVAAISRAGGVQWGGTGKVILHGKPDMPSECVAALMPILKKCKNVNLEVADVEEVTPLVLAAMQQHLTTVPTFKWATFSSCTYTPGVWRSIIPSLPSQICLLSFRLDEPHIHAHDGPIMEESRLIEMCVHANRPVCIELAGYEQQLEVGWQERVQAAMAAAGHQHVRFVQARE